MNKTYEIIQDLEWKCRVSNIEDKGDFVIFEVVKYDTGEFLCSVVRDKSEINMARCNEGVKNCVPTTIHRVAIRLKTAMYHRVTWDDKRQGKTTQKVYETQCNTDNTPVVYYPGSIIVLFERFAGGGRNGELVGNQMCQDYKEVDSPDAQAWLQRNKTAEQESFQDDYDDSCYDCDDYNSDDAELRRLEEYEMSEEDMIMNALENGQGEYYGF